MTAPTIREAIDHLREHYSLTMTETLTLVRAPLHPRELRDEFAMAALTGMLARDVPRAGFEYVASDAYRYADAMVEARNANR